MRAAARFILAVGGLAPLFAGTASAIELDVRREKLANGLRVVLSVDHTSPTVAACVVYDVGARNEERGRSGIAHLFEHLMFQGSRNVGPGEHFRLVTGHGGVLQALTTSDRTSFSELLPESELALGLWLEADRMKTLDLRQATLDSQRDVLADEVRTRVEGQPYGPATLRLRELVFEGYWPYEHGAQASVRDLAALDLEGVRAFHRRYYGPNNAVLAVAGDLDPDETMRLAGRFFGGAPPLSDLPREGAPAALPEQSAPRDTVIDDPNAVLPALLYGWAVPPGRDKDHPAAELTAILLGDGEGSRLHRALVREQGLALEVSARLADQRGPDLLQVVVKLASQGTVPRVVALVEGELHNLAKLGPSDAEMAKARSRARSRVLLGLQSNLGRAQVLAQLELDAGDARLVNTELDRVLEVTKEDVKRVAATYLTEARRSRVEVKPPAPTRVVAPVH